MPPAVRRRLGADHGARQAAARWEGSAVFIEDFIDVDLAIAEVIPWLATGAPPWMAPCAQQAEEAGADVVVRIGPGGLLSPARQRVRVRVGPARRRADGVVVPVEWETVRLRPLFPSLEGDLEAVPLGRDRSRLTLSGQYRPPLGTLGAGLDRRVLHRVAESTVRSFLSGLARQMEARPAPVTTASGESVPATSGE